MSKFMVLSLLLVLLIAGLVIVRSHSRGLAPVASQSKDTKSSQVSPLPPESMAANGKTGDSNNDDNNRAEDKPPLDSTSSTVVEVNGRKIIVPPNSSYSQTFNDPGSQTSVSVKSSQHSSQDGSGSSSSSSSSSSVEVNSH